MKITKKKKGIKIKQLFNESLIDECETLFNKIHNIQSFITVKTQNVDDFDGLEVTMDICSLLIYLKEKKDKRYFDICKNLNPCNENFGIDSNGENGILICIDEEENEEMKEEGMKNKLDSNEIINE